MKFKTIILSCLLIFFCTITHVAAESQSDFRPDGPEFYIGIGSGYTAVDLQIPPQVGGVGVVDDNSIGANLFAGLKINPFFGIEFGYTYFGKARWTPPGSTTTLEVEGDTFKLEGIFLCPLDIVTGSNAMKYFEPFAKVGINYWDAEYFAASPSGNQNIDNDDGDDIVYGFGVNFYLNRHLRIRTMWERIETDGDVDFYSGNLIYSF